MLHDSIYKGNHSDFSIAYLYAIFFNYQFICIQFFLHHLTILVAITRMQTKEGKNSCYWPSVEQCHQPVVSQEV
jgi:hypothetical protein